MTTFRFLVQGSSTQPYEVIFYSSSNSMTATCTCNAGLNGQSCKHRLNILNNDMTGIISGNEKDIGNVLIAFRNTPLEFKLKQLEGEEREIENLKKKIALTKKQIANIFLGK